MAWWGWLIILKPTIFFFQNVKKTIFLSPYLSHTLVNLLDTCMFWLSPYAIYQIYSMLHTTELEKALMQTSKSIYFLKFYFLLNCYSDDLKALFGLFNPFPCLPWAAARQGGSYFLKKWCSFRCDNCPLGMPFISPSCTRQKWNLG